jgi:hypothetical protein
MTLSKPSFMRSVMSRGRKHMLRMTRYHGVSVARMSNTMVAEVLWNLEEEKTARKERKCK